MMNKLDFRYYLITSRKACAPRLLPEVVEEACAAGIQAVQLREKDLAGKDLCELAHQIRDITARFEVRLFINGRPDIAEVVGADGVHCPENGFPPEAIQQYWPEFSVGASVHSLEAAKKAEKEGADFLLFGPVFFTPSKEEYGKPQGTDRLEKVCESTSIPVFAVGGVTPEKVPECLQAGAFGVSGISALMEADDVGGKVEAFNNQFN
jgi:thiamine-phosphate pyrophosphorylase